MNNRYCPDCGNYEFSKLEKGKISAFGGNLRCRECGSKLRLSTRYFSILVASLTGTILFYVVLFTAAGGNYWWEILTISFGWGITTIMGYIVPLKRLGTKRFKL
jgi:hypothetical protein